MYLRAQTVCEMLDMPMSTFQQLVRRGELPQPVSKLGRSKLWRKDAILARVDPALSPGYSAANDPPPKKHPPASTPQRQREVLLPSGAWDVSTGNPGQASQRSAFDGVLASTRDGERVARNWEFDRKAYSGNG